MKKILLLTTILACVAFANPYTKCAGCHGANGEKAALGGKSKVLIEMTKAEIVTALKGYKDGTYGGAMKGLMTAQAKLLSDADIELISQMGK